MGASQMPKEKITLHRLSPNALVKPQRLDVLCKYRLFKEYQEGYIFPETLDFYSQHIHYRTGGQEPKMITEPEYQKSEKKNIRDYQQQGIELYHSLKEYGFDHRYFISYRKDKGILGGGAHRLAASLALQQDVYVNYIKTSGCFWNFDWFKRYFDADQLMYLLYDYIKLSLDSTNIFVFYGPSKPHWQEFYNLLASKFHIVGDFPIILRHQYAMIEMIQELYQRFDVKDSDHPVMRKSKLLASRPERQIYVVVVADKEGSEKIFYEKCREVKLQARELARDTIHKKLFMTLHCGDHQQDSWDLAQILLSPNNIKHLHLRHQYGVRLEFQQYLKEYAHILKHYKIDKEKTCIVRGAGLEALGIKKSGDIDFTMSEELRRQYFHNGEGKLGKHIDFVVKNYHRAQDKQLFCDDVLIDNPRLHFIYRGFKVANLDIIKDRKEYSLRSKDLKDLEIIHQFQSKPVEHLSLNWSDLLAQEYIKRSL
jgi:hypothetical protein